MNIIQIILRFLKSLSNVIWFITLFTLFYIANIYLAFILVALFPWLYTYIEYALFISVDGVLFLHDNLTRVTTISLYSVEIYLLIITYFTLLKLQLRQEKGTIVWFLIGYILYKLFSGIFFTTTCDSTAAQTLCLFFMSRHSPHSPYGCKVVPRGFSSSVVRLVKGDIKKNNLSLKSLKDELESLKSQNSTSALSSQTVTTDSKGKQSIVTRFVRTSSLPVFWVISTLLTYAHKIPFISKGIKILSLWYGRTTWWKMLVSLRKVFIIINALIGVYTVFKVTGFSTDNIIGGFYGLGGTYIEMLGSFTKRLFNWLVEFFDHKVVPKPPTNPNTSWKWWGPKEHTWYGRSMNNDGLGRMVDLAKTQDFYKSPFSLSSNNSSTWSFKDILWYGGIALVSIGVLYLGFTFVAETFFPSREHLGKAPFPATRGGSSSADIPLPGSPASDAPLPEIRINDVRAPAPSAGSAGGAAVESMLGGIAYMGRSISHGISNATNAVSNILNPFNYFTTNTVRDAQFNTFMERQYDPVMADHRFYPFSVDNPYAPWYDRWATALFGESRRESYIRFQHIDWANSVYNKIHIRGDGLEFSSPLHSPNLTTMLGLGDIVNIDSNTVWDAVRAVNVENKLASLTSTPKQLPSIPISGDLLADVSAWSRIDTPVEPSTVATTSQVKVDAAEDPSTIATSSQVKVEDLAPIDSSTVFITPSAKKTSIRSTYSYADVVMRQDKRINYDDLVDKNPFSALAENNFDN